MKTILFFLVFIIFCNNLYSQVDSSEYYLNLIKNQKLKYHEINEYLDKAMHWNNKNKEVYLRKALLLYYGFGSDKDKDTAFYFVNRAINLDSTYADAYYLKATMFVYYMQDDSTLKYINKAIFHNPKDARYYKVRATAYTEDYSEKPQNLILAEKDMDTAIKLMLKNPEKNDEHRRQLGFYYRIRGDIKELRGDWKGSCLDYKNASNLGEDIQNFDKDCNCEEYKKIDP